MPAPPRTCDMSSISTRVVLALGKMPTLACSISQRFWNPTRGRGRMLFARLALLGLLFATVAPGVSHWLARNDAAPLWFELCRQAGIDRPALLPLALQRTGASGQAPAAPAFPSGEGAGDRQDACGYCVLQASWPTPPTASAGLPVQLARSIASASLHRSLVAPLHWTSPPSRAPPGLFEQRALRA